MQRPHLKEPGFYLLIQLSESASCDLLAPYALFDLNYNVDVKLLKDWLTSSACVMAPTDRGVSLKCIAAKFCRGNCD